MSYNSSLNGYDFTYIVSKFFKICCGLYGTNNPYRFNSKSEYESALNEWQISLSTLPEEQIVNCEEFAQSFYRSERFSERPPTFYEFSNCDDFDDFFIN